jgi:hypothetical protein
MVIQVDLFIDSQRVAYKVEHHVDGIFIAKMDWYAGLMTPSLPQKIFMIRTPTGWKGDSRKEFVDQIGQHIDKAIKNND